MLSRNFLVLGDNPFFGISHAGFQKSKEYLNAKDHLSQCVEVVKLSGKMGIDTMMISSHDRTAEFLDLCGYSQSGTIHLPSLALVIPNVHKQNAESANRGIVAMMLYIVRKVLFKVCLQPIRFLKNPIMSAFSEFINLQMEGLNKSKVKYIFIHNIYVDLLIGLRAYTIINLLLDSIRYSGFEPGLITMNPKHLDKIKLEGVNICVYYNLNGYNMVANHNTLIDLKKFKKVKLWAMGILASGAISPTKAMNDEKLQYFDRVIYATGKPDRLKEFLTVLKK